MRLYIIRHGETDWNVLRRLQGQTDIALNENGREVARQTAEGMKNVRIDLVLTSPLQRAVETARIVIGDRQIPVLEEPMIQEISFGSLEGSQLTKELRDTPGSEYYRFFHTPELYCPPQDGESLDSLLERTGTFLELLKTRTEWMNRNILVSTHGAASRALLASVRHTAKADFWAGGVPKNCAVTIVDLEDQKWIIREQDRLYY